MAARLSQAEKNRRLKEREKQKRAVAKAREKLKSAKTRLSALMKKAVPVSKMERHAEQIAAAEKLVKLAEENLKLAQRKPAPIPEPEELPGPEDVDFSDLEDLPGPEPVDFPEDLPGPDTVASSEERAVVQAVDNYRELLTTGMVSHGGGMRRIDPVTPGPDYDVDSSSRGAVMVNTADTHGILLKDENVEEIMYMTRDAIRDASMWGDPIYAVIQMFQPEPTYAISTDIGRAGGKPDGWIWEHPTDKKQKLFSTWQGVPATTDTAALEDALERHLEAMVKANGTKNVAIVHKIEIRSVPSNEVKKR